MVESKAKPVKATQSHKATSTLKLNAPRTLKKGENQKIFIIAYFKKFLLRVNFFASLK